jgi:hypothetical protein
VADLKATPVSGSYVRDQIPVFMATEILVETDIALRDDEPVTWWELPHGVFIGFLGTSGHPLPTDVDSALIIDTTMIEDHYHLCWHFSPSPIWTFRRMQAVVDRVSLVTLAKRVGGKERRVGFDLNLLRPHHYPSWLSDEIATWKQARAVRGMFSDWYLEKGGSWDDLNEGLHLAIMIEVPPGSDCSEE